MKRKFTGIILAVLIMALIVTFLMIGCKNTINARPAATVATTAAPTS
jgi:hypothetical protein